MAASLANRRMPADQHSHQRLQESEVQADTRTIHVNKTQRKVSPKKSMMALVQMGGHGPERLPPSRREAP